MNDFLSDSEPDLSQYQAEVCPSFQTVALVTANPQHISARLQQSSSSPKFLNLERHRRTPSSSQQIDDDSSPEELSYHGDDLPDDEDDFEQLQINLPCDNKSLKGNFSEIFGVKHKQLLNSDSNKRIPEYSVREETKNVRSFQLITLPDGKTREIDMKVS